MHGLLCNHLRGYICTYRMWDDIYLKMRTFTSFMKFKTLNQVNVGKVTMPTGWDEHLLGRVYMCSNMCFTSRCKKVFHSLKQLKFLARSNVSLRLNSNAKTVSKTK